MLYRFIILFSFSIVFSVFSYSQQIITSIQNGNFSDIMSWDCNCIPQDGDTVIINHEVLLDQDLTMNSGKIVIGTGGNLVAVDTIRKLSIIHSEMFNSGNIHIGNLLLDSAIVESPGAIIIDDDYVQSDNLPVIIDGVLLVNDTLFLANTSFLRCNNFLSANVIYAEGMLFLNNSGDCISMELFDDFQLIGDGNELIIRNNLMINGGAFNILNEGTAFVQNNVYNLGVMFLNPGSELRINNSLFNGNTISPNGELISLQAKIIVKNDFINYKSVVAGGCFSVQNYSANHEYFFGNVDFCDETGGMFDLNTGTIDSTVTYCTIACELKEEANMDIDIYPNPFQDLLSLSVGDTGANKFLLINSLGKEVMNYTVNSSNEIISVGFLSSGFYYFILKKEDFIIQSGKLIKD